MVFGTAAAATRNYDNKNSQLEVKKAINLTVYSSLVALQSTLPFKNSQLHSSNSKCEIIRSLMFEPLKESEIIPTRSS